MIGFTYFAGTLFSLLVTGIYDVHALFILAWLNVIALPYIIFSIYYQARIARQWCVMCLSVQAILVLQFIVALVGGLHTFPGKTITPFNIFTIFICFLFSYLLVSLLVPAMRKAKENKQNKTALQRLRHNPQIFEALLAKQKTVTESTDSLGITLGNPNAKHKIIKVCNPYCGPCAAAHKHIEDLLKSNEDLQLKIIFMASSNDKRTPPVRHLMTLDQIYNNENKMKKALDDWYSADKKDYELFAIKYPIDKEMIVTDEKLDAMHQWCNKMKIMFTPTFFVDGYQLPMEYSISDLKYFLSF